METDLLNIQEMAQIKWNENWEFRSFLRNHPIPSEKLDAMVHELFSAVSGEIDCTVCANCCKHITPVLENDDIKKLSESLCISVTRFKEKFVKKDPYEGLIFKTTPCPFLENNLCSQYEHRPKDCRSFPHLHKSDVTSRLIGVIENYEFCPIVFNVFERLKGKFYGDAFYVMKNISGKSTL
jgi:Fe-S-cluster containining protein